MSERTRRLDQLLREEISAIIRREVDDPRVGFATVTSVEVTPDLSHASVWVSVIGSDEERRASIAALTRAMPFVRHHLGRLRLKRIPELRVREDSSFERGTRVMQLLEKIEAASASAVTPDADGVAAPATPVVLPSPGPSHAEGIGEGDAKARGGRPRRKVDRPALRKARAGRGR